MSHALPDIIAKDLDVLFCGINPGLMAAAQGRQFAGRSNWFWRVLHQAGFTPEELSPGQGRVLLTYGCGVTSVVKRPTASAAALSAAEFGSVANAFERKIARYRPRCVAFLGKAAYAGMKGLRSVNWGLQPECMSDSRVWVLPNPSGRNRSFTLDRLTDAYRDLYLEIEAARDRRSDCGV